MTSRGTLLTLGLAPGTRQRIRCLPLSRDRRFVHPTEFGCIRLVRARWRGLCASIGVVRSRSRNPSAIALIVAFVAATGSSLIAECAQPEACPMQHDECERTAKIIECCCGHASDASHQGGPIESPVQLTADRSTLPVALAVGAFTDISGTSLRFHSAPPSVSPPDFATRFAPLLI